MDSVLAHSVPVDSVLAHSVPVDSVLAHSVPVDSVLAPGLVVHSLLVGAGLGFLVALQLGPMSLLLVRSTLRAGLRTGCAVGLGIALVDAVYAAVGAAGAAPLLLVGPVRAVLGTVGAAVLVALGVLTLRAAWHVAGVPGGAAAAAPWPAFRTAVGGTAANPTTIASWAAVFSAAGATGGTAAVPMVAGVGLGSLSWVTLLAVLTAVVRRSVGVRAVRVADAVAGVGLVAFGVALGVQAWH